MAAIDAFLPAPRLRELDAIDVGVPVERAFRHLETVDLGALPITRALFSLRALPDALSGRASEPWDLRMETLLRSRHAFRLLHAEPGAGWVIGAIGRVWEPSIPFVDVAPDAYAAFAEPGEAKVCWELRADPLTRATSRISIEVRVTTTDDASWSHFRRYFFLIGPFSRLIRRMMLHHVARELGTPEIAESTMTLAGDAFVLDAMATHTDAITIEAPPERVWPWLLQMGGDRAGWYSWDALDHGGVPSAREIDPRLAHLGVGDLVHALPDAKDGFRVLAIEPERALVLGNAIDLDTDRTLSPSDPMPPHHWRSTWAFVLQPHARGTRLLVRVRGDWSPDRVVWRARLGLLAHAFMQPEQLRNLKLRAEGTLPRDTRSDVLEGLEGAARIAATLATSFLREERSHWGLDAEAASRPHPGDELVPDPRWSWTHAIEVDAPAERVWPWVAQIGADRAGFYSYQFLENLARCDLRNADRIHAEWQRDAARRSPMILHPAMPPLPIARIEPGRYFVAHVAPAAGDPNEASVSWLFLVEPLAGGRSRIVSRFRSSYAPRLAARLAMGPALTEPIGFVMDRRMLLGLKERAERA